MSRLFCGVCLGLALGATGPVRAQRAEEIVARAAELLDEGNPAAAQQLLDGVLERDPDNVRGLLLRSTARFQSGMVEAGEADLRRCLELDPSQRQGWLNLAGLEMSRGEHAAALEHLETAEVLDPEASDNDINIGATLLLLGRLEEASERFQKHLGHPAATGADYYLVATNYAMAGYSALALRLLTEAVRRDEKTRLRARTDPNFSDMVQTAEFRELLETDLFVPEPGSYVAARSFGVPYEVDRKQLLNATLDALRALRVPYSQQVEVTPAWSLIWADFRIKLSRDPDSGGGRVELSAPAPAFKPDEWRRRTDQLFEEIEQTLPQYRDMSQPRR